MDNIDTGLGGYPQLIHYHLLGKTGFPYDLSFIQKNYRLPWPMSGWKDTAFTAFRPGHVSHIPDAQSIFPYELPL
jgi:hypothetical protein